ncbi:DUF4097 family beta strand repeat-containing protein [Agromyces silvae]|uniref:DUF4097 family beta strand repeat-containing protein n=1 Tax=Agromyces silvae TaxID=3388266 RepID=UPI00280B2A37|nr:DUF4097 family beta strand repeat-containing protein [Agromyces protaetiae]
MTIEQWSIAPGESRVIDLELVRTLKVSLVGGKVDLIAHDEPGARVEISNVSGKDLAVSIDGDRLEIDHPQLRWDNFLEVFANFRGHAKADVSILAPRTVALKLGVVTGEALVSGFDGDARFSTVSGDVVVDNHRGDVELSSVSGELSAGNHVGRVKANSVSGDVIASGEISAFTAKTVSGSMILDAKGTPAKVDTNTVSGDLTVRCDLGSGARYRVNSVSGTLLIDDSQFRGVLGKGFERTVGELAGDWLDLSANSVTGNISVMHRAGAGRADASGSAEASDGVGEGASE